MKRELSLTELSGLFWHSKTGQKILIEHREKFLAQRKAAAEAITAIDTALARDLPLVIAAYNESDREYHAAFEALKAADRARRNRYGDMHNVENRARSAKIPHEKTLKATQAPEIGILYGAISDALNAPQGVTTMRELSEAELAKVHALRVERMNAMKALDTLWVEPLDDAELSDRLGALAQRARVTFPTTNN